MSTPFVTFPGASGNYLDREDTNLLDADTAHMVQSPGIWSVGAVVTDEPTQFGGTAIEYDWGVAGAKFWQTSGTPRISATAATVYSASVTFKVDDASKLTDTQARCYLQFFDSGDVSLGSQYGDYVTGIVSDTWVTLEALSKTAPASTSYVKIIVQFVTSGANLVGSLGEACVREGSSSVFVPSLRIVGDLDLRALVAADDYTPADQMSLLAIDHAASVQTPYVWTIRPTGDLQFAWSEDGTTQTYKDSVDPSFVNGETYEVRATLDVAAPTLRYYVDGVQLGSDIISFSGTTPSSPTSYFQSGGPQLVGQHQVTGSYKFPFDGDIYWAEVRDGIGDSAPIVARFDAADVARVLP